MSAVELAIQNLNHAGEGLARLAGRVVFVPGALPGETVRAEIVQEKKGFARARLLEVLSPAPDRIAPRCPHHAAPRAAAGALACGGCQLQHLAYPAQLAFKQTQVSEQLRRVGGLAEPSVRPTVPAPAPFGYRNHLQFALAPEGQLGFKAAGSDAVVPIRECPIAEPALMDLFGRLNFESVPAVERVSLRLGAEAEQLLIFEAAADAPEVELDLPISAALLRPDGAALALAGRDYLVLTVKGRDFKVSAGSFFQVNTAMAERLVDEVLAALDLRGGETVLDLYCGVGLFAAFLAPHAGRLIGVEAFEPAVEDAAVNLDEFDHVEIYCAPAEDALPGLDARPAAVVADPPRAGLGPEVVGELLRLGPARLAYVSCDPATLARDARQLVAGGYDLAYAQPLDMFPQTHHVECLALFTRRQ